MARRHRCHSYPQVCDHPWCRLNWKVEVHVFNFHKIMSGFTKYNAQKDQLNFKNRVLTFNKTVQWFLFSLVCALSWYFVLSMSLPAPKHISVNKTGKKPFLAFREIYEYYFRFHLPVQPHGYNRGWDEQNSKDNTGYKPVILGTQSHLWSCIWKYEIDIVYIITILQF